MKYFEQAQENLKRSNFYKALELFQISINEDALSNEQKVFCCEKIEKINQILKRETTKELLLFLAEHYFNLEKYERAQESYETLFKETGEIYFLKKQFEALSLAGDVFGSLKISTFYLENLYKNRLSDEIVKFTQEYKSILKPTEISSWTMRAFVLSGNVKGLESEVITWSEYKLDERQELYQELLDLTGHDAKYWHSSIEILKALWFALLDREMSFILPKKSVIKLLLDYWLVLEKDHDLMRETIELAEKFNLPIVGHNIARYVGDFDLEEKFLERMPRSAFQADDFDFGEDLFGENTEDIEKKIERDIRFLLKSGKKSDVLKLAYKLEKINPHHELVEKLVRTKEALTSNISEDRVTELLVEIEKFVPSKEEDEEVSNSFLGIVKYYEKDFIQENFEDMIIGFRLVNLPLVALELIKKVDRSSLSDREHVNLNYLEIETYIECGQFYKARDLAEDTLATVPLVGEERVAIAYLRAESYYQLGNYDYAKKLFKSLAQNSPRYRLTEQRIMRLEKN